MPNEATIGRCRMLPRCGAIVHAMQPYHGMARRRNGSRHLVTKRSSIEIARWGQPLPAGEPAIAIQLLRRLSAWSGSG
jgi:hypothetical protein